MEAVHIPGSDTSADQKLVCAAQAGDTAAFGELVQRYTGMVFALAYAGLSDRDAAEDLVQEVFLRAFISLPSLTQPRYFSTWLSRIARNLATDWQRSRTRRSHTVSMLSLEEVEQLPVTQTASITREHERRENERVLTRAMTRLSPEQREIVLLHFAEGWSLTEISAQLNVHRTTVGRHLEQAIARLREDIEPMLRETCQAAQSSSKLPARAAAAVAALAAMPTIGQAKIIAHLPALSSSAATALQSAGTTSAAATAANSVGVLQITGAAAAAGGTIALKKTTVVGIVVLLGLAGAGYYAKDRVVPYFGVGGIPPPPGVMAGLPAQAPVGTIEIKPATSSRMAMSSGNGSMRASAVDLQNAIANTFKGYGGARVIYDGVSPTGQRFDIAATVPSNQPQALGELLQREIPKVYGVTITKEQREMDVLVMKAPQGDKLLTPGSGFGNAHTKPTEAVLNGATSQSIADTIAGNAKVVVFDETGLTGRYNVTLKAKMQDKDSVIRAAREQLGLELVPARRKVDVLVVRKAA